MQPSPGQVHHEVSDIEINYWLQHYKHCLPLPPQMFRINVKNTTHDTSTCNIAKYVPGGHSLHTLKNYLTWRRENLRLSF